MNEDYINEGYSPENGEEKTPCILALDVSGSMNGVDAAGEAKFVQVQKGLNEVISDISSDPLASQRVEFGIILFNHNATLVQKPALVENLNIPTIFASGGTNIAAAMRMAIDIATERKDYYVKHGITYKRPIIVLMTDGQAPVDSIVKEAEEGSAGKHFYILPIAVGDDADMSALNRVASDRAFKIKEGHISSFFRWLSNSIAVIANADPKASVTLENPYAGWAVNG